jgi:uncharacterized protein (DUF934 family)
MVLINLTGIQPKDFDVLDADAAPSDGQTILVPFERLVEEGSALYGANGSLGVQISTETSYEDLAAHVKNIDFALIHFPAFGDGRGFSLAVRLRKDFGFKGEIRAVGHTLPDQALFLLRAGFDIIDAPEEREDAFKAALDKFSAFYQTDFNGQTSIAHARHNSAGAVQEAKEPEGQRKIS